MTDAGKRIIQSAKEALALTRSRITINGRSLSPIQWAEEATRITTAARALIAKLDNIGFWQRDDAGARAISIRGEIEALRSALPPGSPEEREP